MFNFLRKPQPHQLTAAITQALASNGLPPGMKPESLSVLEQQGSYSGRRVNYFRVFDPVRVAERSVQVRVYNDLDTHQELILGEGHVEHNGAVVLTHRAAAQPQAAFSRSNAVRADHGDDEQFVFPGRVS